MLMNYINDPRPCVACVFWFLQHFLEGLLVMGHLEGRGGDGGQSIAKPIRKQEAKVKRVILDGKAGNL